ncbi:MAG: cytochrome b/b6 domain-containing protein [Rhodomicrobium sp.]
MTIQTEHRSGHSIPVHSRFVRVTHWLNAIAILVMIGSGWRIYNNVPIFPWFTFPEWATLGGDPEITYALNKDVGFSNALLWHFAFMWLFFVNGIAALSVGILSGRLRRKWLPITFGELIHDIREALTFNLAHDDITIYNAVQKLLYIGVACAMILMLASGLAIWKPVQFHWLTWLFYDFQGARLVHFLGMSSIVLFLMVHVSLSILVPQTIVAMTRGSIRAPEPEEIPVAALAYEPAELPAGAFGMAPADEYAAAATEPAPMPSDETHTSKVGE